MRTKGRARTQLLDGSLDVLHATLLAHLLGREVAVQTSTVPVTRDWLGLYRDLGAELLSNTVQQEPGEPEVVTHLNALTWADLELPLGGHDLGVGTRDLDTGVEAAAVVGLHNITLDNLARADTTVVRALGSGESSKLVST